MRDHLRGLCLCQAVVHSAIEVVPDLRNLAGSNQSADSNETPISGRKSGRSHRSRNKTSVVYCTMPGATLPTAVPQQLNVLPRRPSQAEEAQAKREEVDQPQFYGRQRHLPRRRLPTSHSPSPNKKRDA